MNLIIRLLIRVIKIYQKVSSQFPSRCRFYPTCSSYAIKALQKYGLFKGTILSIIRILKCHPGHPGGYDPVK